MEEENAWKNQSRISATLCHFMEAWLLCQRLWLLCFSDGGRWSLWPTVPFGRSSSPCSLQPPWFLFLSCLPTKPSLAYPLPLSEFHTEEDMQMGRQQKGRNNSGSVCGEAGLPLRRCPLLALPQHILEVEPRPNTHCWSALQRAGLAKWEGPVLVIGITNCQIQEKWFARTGPAWDAVRQLVLGLQRWAQNREGNRRCSQWVTLASPALRGIDRVSWQNCMTTKQKMTSCLRFFTHLGINASWYWHEKCPARRHKQVVNRGSNLKQIYHLYTETS